MLGIYEYIAVELHEPEIANRLVRNIRIKLNTLKDFPDRNHMISSVDNELANVRCCPVENYMIFYQVAPELHRVYILRILYKKRNWEEIL